MQSPSVWSKLSPLANEERRGERGTTLSPGAKPLSLFGDATRSLWSPLYLASRSSVVAWGVWLETVTVI